MANGGGGFANCIEISKLKEMRRRKITDRDIVAFGFGPWLGKNDSELDFLGIIGKWDIPLQIYPSPRKHHLHQWAITYVDKLHN